MYDPFAIGLADRRAARKMQDMANTIKNCAKCDRPTKESELFAGVCRHCPPPKVTHGNAEGRST